jgi:hypothetical protein
MVKTAIDDVFNNGLHVKHAQAELEKTCPISQSKRSNVHGTTTTGGAGVEMASHAKRSEDTITKDVPLAHSHGQLFGNLRPTSVAIAFSGISQGIHPRKPV